jgi:hypothetical protein
VRAALLPCLVLVVLGASACSRTETAKHATTAPTGPVPQLTTAVARTTAAPTAHFTVRTLLDAAGTVVEADESGTASFRSRRAHIYKLNSNGGIPGEAIVIGPFLYTNDNVQAALQDPSVRPWTKLDTRLLNKRERASQADDVAHALAGAYLAAGVKHPLLVGRNGALTEYRGRIDPSLLASRLPKAVRGSITTAVRADYPNRTFSGRFWLDTKGRVRRVLVSYKTAAGTPVLVDTKYSDFGAPVDTSLPPVGDIKTIIPNH